MIREIAAALGGVLSGIAAFLIVLFYPGATNPGNVTSTGFYRQQPITTPIAAPQYGQLYYGSSGGISSIFPAVLLLVLSIGVGILISYLGGARLKGEEIS